MNSNTSFVKVLIVFILGLVVGYWFGSGQGGADTDKKTEEKMMASKMIQLTFMNHIQANMPEQDVFIVSKDNAGKLMRVEGDGAKDANNLSQEVYAAATAIEHDPFKVGENPLGPFPKGEKLGFTLQKWLDAKGIGKYSVEGDKAELDIMFEKLAPSGVYTVWCSRIKLPPDPKVIDKPCGAPDGSENIFKADAEGNASFKLTMPLLEESTKSEVSVIALAYHSDAKTYGADPGLFGKNSHVQIFYIFPEQKAMTQPTP